jgi:cytochrome P450
MDPPDHTRLRKLVASGFTPRRVEAMRPRIARIVTALIDAMLGSAQPVDFVQSFSRPLPTQVICGLLGVPFEDSDRFHSWVDAITGNWERDQGTMWAGFAGLASYLGELVKAKRTTPADDLLSALVAACDGDDKLSESEPVMLALTVLVAGHETAVNHIALSLLTLLRHPDEVARLRTDVDRIPHAVEELLRYVQLAPPLPLNRVATEDTELGGVRIPAGGVVGPLYALANRDPRAFPDPDRFDPDRFDPAQFDPDQAPSRHVTFGWGAHYCLGAALARVELQEVFRGLLARLPGLRLAVPASELRFREQSWVYSLAELPVTWDD